MSGMCWFRLLCNLYSNDYLDLSNYPRISDKMINFQIFPFFRFLDVEVNICEIQPRRIQIFDLAKNVTAAAQKANTCNRQQTYVCHLLPDKAVRTVKISYQHFPRSLSDKSA